MEAIRAENEAKRCWAAVEFSSEALVEIAADACLLSCHASARWSDRSSADEVDCLTVYVRREGRWRIASHQQT